MGFVDKIKNMISVPEDDYYDDMPEETNFAKNASEPVDDISSSSGYHGSYSSAQPAPSYSGEKRNKVVNIHATTQLQVVLVKPERFDDAPSVADHLNAKRTVVLNLESASRETSRRLIDFLSGVAYANKGQIKRVANSTFIITPFDVDIMGDLILDELESSNMYI